MREVIGPLKSVQFIIRVTTELHQEIIRAAAAEKLSAAEFSRRAIEEKLATGKKQTDNQTE